ncbi:MAG: phage tail protein [Cyanobacteria bacterium CRU_2_1]|nr:phage tail protein [Cyanobacteria bacterium RU_5_0]NJR57838.1 phage tail protein [Cyanobacteria bacterium CRU_2_1]
MPEPYRGFNFLVEIDGITEAGFQECGGLDIMTDPVEYREGTDPNHVRKLTGLNKFSPITLKRGITDSDMLWRWQQTVATGRTERRNISIVLLDEARQEKWRWNLRNAWPSKWTGPSFNATSNDVAVESLEICHEEMVKA